MPKVVKDEHPGKVQVYVPKTEFNKDGLPVCVNGKKILIMPGVPVWIDEAFAEVLMQSEYMQSEAERMMREAKEAKGQGDI